MMQNPKKITTLSTTEALNRAQTQNIIEQIAELNVFRTLLHHPKLAKAVNDLLMMLLAGGNTLSARHRELIIMRIAWLTGSDYEWTQHWKIALQFGLSEDTVLAVQQWQNSDCFALSDIAVLAATDETLAQGMISSATWDACAKHLTIEQLLELNVAIGAWRLISQLAKSAGIELESGVSSWPPNGVTPV